MGTDHYPNECTHGSTEENGADCAGHNTSGLKALHLDPAADRSERHYRSHQKFETSMGRTLRQTTRQQIDYQSNGLDTRE